MFLRRDHPGKANPGKANAMTSILRRDRRGDTSTWKGGSREFSESESRSVVSDSLWPHELYGSWNSPGQNTGVGGHVLLQGIFSTQGLNPGLPHCRQILYQLSHQGSQEISVMQPKEPRNATRPKKIKETRKNSQSLQREWDTANTFSLDFWPPDCC